jgi:protein ImuB
VPPKGLAFALVETGAKGLRLAAVNKPARSFGLARGQRLADARAAVPDLLSEIHEPEHDVTSLLGLCRWMERYSPWVAPDMPDGILLDITGIPHLFGGEAPMLAEITARLKAYGFTARTGLAETIGAAWALARYDSGSGNVASLPIEALRIDVAAARTLRRLGLKTIGALSELPRASLARRFRGESIHENVLLRLDELQGKRQEPLNPINPPSSFMAHRALMEPVLTHDGLVAILTGLTETLSRDLAKQSKGATRLILKLFRTDGSRVQVPAGLSTPSHDGGHIFRLLQPKLDAIDAGFGIDAMTLEAREVAPAIRQQYGFMEEDVTMDLEQLHDRVNNRHGRGFAALDPTASYIPERAEKPIAYSSQNPKPKAGPAILRPLLIFDPPEPVRVIAAVPDGPPMRLTWRKVTRKIIRTEGPERIAPEWWRLHEGERPRDYYRIEDEQGRRYWLYRDGLYGEDDPTPPKWFVHGLSV